MHAPSLVQTGTQRFKYKRSLIKSELQQLTLKHRHSIDIIFSGHECIMNEWHITSVNIIMCNNKAQPRNLEKTKTKQKKPHTHFCTSLVVSSPLI